jgi:hypothetical protein
MIVRKYAKMARYNWAALADSPARFFAQPPMQEQWAAHYNLAVVHPYVAPHDVSMGTWFGINAQGLFVGLTNGMGSRGLLEGEHSRGEALLKALALTDNAVAAADLLVQELEEQSYGYCNIIAIGADQGQKVTFSENGVNRQAIRPGIHVLTNYNGNPPQNPISQWSCDDSHYRNERLDFHLHQWAPTIENPGASQKEILEFVQNLMSDHHPDQGSQRSICKHAHNDSLDMPRTTSNTTLLLHQAGIRVSSLYYAAGNLCSHPFADRSGELKKLTSAHAPGP